MTTDDTINLIAKVLAWQEGSAIEDINDVASGILMQDAALQCAEDLGLA